MDDFKKYMLRYADEMDFDEPGEAVWKNIAEKTKKPKQGGNVVRFVHYAAAACFILFASFAAFLVNHHSIDVANNNLGHETKVTKPEQRQPQKPAEVQQKMQEPLAKQTFKKRVTAPLSIKNAVTVHREHRVDYKQQQQNALMLQNIDSSFSQLVSIQLSKVRSLPLYAEGPEYYSEFKKQFQQLEEDEKELKKVIQKNGLSNENLGELINVFQQKLNLLKLLQNEINKTNSRYRQNNHSDTTYKINYINI